MIFLKIIIELTLFRIYILVRVSQKGRGETVLLLIVKNNGNKTKLNVFLAERLFSMYDQYKILPFF